MTSVTGDKLPSARKVSSSLEPDRNRPLNGVTLLTMTFGQFLAHDFLHSVLFEGQAFPSFFFNQVGVSHTSIIPGPNGTSIPCCTPEGKFFTDPKDMHFACLPVAVPRDDPFYAQHGVECLPFTRAVPSKNFDCTFGYAQQMNQLTHVIDWSPIYGKSEVSKEKRLGPCFVIC